MKLGCWLLIGLGLLASSGRAETRWCPIISKEPAQPPAYPEFARIARIRGEVAIRVIYLPSGALIGAEPVSGPGVLSHSLLEESKSWTIHTDATGELPCQTLVIARFTITDDGVEYYNKPIERIAPSIFRLSTGAIAEPVAVETDTLDPIYYSNPAKQLFHSFKRAVVHCFYRSGEVKD